ncbi:hypothetical protein ABEF95_005844 [Exophiala dermatitidis]|uniref:CENP-V/GFA domain-containing protein n=2 Tax=Exophiala dermatitidis TaxID=5970 RepID=H6C7Q2_EXODN|nr:uncharacterized protein HMPREF1120_06884 [Exophiala dermatitidis NIH/UT8656]EHY58882.1 hypothetical protein HMPREF1120_06884 [Exophiala dermatitidis NIH/UT8656]
MAAPQHLTCLCGLVKEPASLLASSEGPFEGSICHCDTCRHTTGALGTWYATLKRSPSEESLSHTTAYKTSSKYTRFFCKQCGCHVFVRSERDGRWLACAGIVETDIRRVEGETKEGRLDNVARVTFHEYVGDAHDGGIAPYMTRLGGRTVPCFLTEPDDGAEPMPENELQRLRTKGLNEASQGRSEYLPVACHCGGVQLHIVPPAYDQGQKDWYVPSDRSKYYARFCCCRSCRLTLGFSMQPWTYIPPGQILTAQEEPVIFGPKAKDAVQIAGLKHYQSSEFVLRSFCTTCGATIFYQSFERPYIIDVSVGVVRSAIGNALAGEWLQWDRSMVSKRNEAVDNELVDAWLKA